MSPCTKTMPDGARSRLQAREVAGVGQRVEHDHRLAGCGQPVVHEVGADEAGAAGDTSSLRHQPPAPRSIAGGSPASAAGPAQRGPGRRSCRARCRGGRRAGVGILGRPERPDRAPARRAGPPRAPPPEWPPRSRTSSPRRRRSSDGCRGAPAARPPPRCASASDARPGGRPHLVAHHAAPRPAPASAGASSARSCGPCAPNTQAVRTISARRRRPAPARARPPSLVRPYTPSGSGGSSGA